MLDWILDFVHPDATTRQGPKDPVRNNDIKIRDEITSLFLNHNLNHNPTQNDYD